MEFVKYKNVHIYIIANIWTLNIIIIANIRKKQRQNCLLKRRKLKKLSLKKLNQNLMWK
jgi:hypothetical protein